MNFEEIMKIDREPFDENVLEDITNPSTMGMFSDNYVMIILLISRYFRQWSKKNGQAIYLLDEENFIVPDRFLNKDYESDLAVEYLSEINYNNADCFWEHISACNWITCRLRIHEYLEYRNTEAEEFFAWSEDKQIEFLLKDFQGIIPENILKDSMGVIRKNASYMEEGEIDFLWNNEIGKLLWIAQNNEKELKEIIPKEYEAFQEVLNELKWPLMYQNAHQYGVFEQTYFIVYDTGFNGSEYLDYGALNYNFIISAFVMSQLLCDIYKKLNGRFDVREQEDGNKFKNMEECLHEIKGNGDAALLPQAV